MSYYVDTLGNLRAIIVRNLFPHNQRHDPKFQRGNSLHVIIKVFFIILFTMTYWVERAYSYEPLDKVSSTLHYRLVDYPAYPVIILGKTQLLSNSDSFNHFCKSNAYSRRTELRRQIIEKLKETAESEQQEILTKLDYSGNILHLWIVNALGVTLTRTQIEKAATLDSIKYIYADRATPVLKGEKGAVAYVIKPDLKRKLTFSGKEIPWNLKEIRVDKVWKELGVTGAGVTVAMFDSGVNYLHPDLKNNTWINPDEVPNNGKDDDGNGLPDDYYGFNFTKMVPSVLAPEQDQHGTWTSGIVAGDGSLGIQTGIAPGSKLMHLIAWGSICNMARAFQYALENKADIMNMSFSWPNLGQERGLVRLICEQATCAGIVSVSGAGNFGKGGSQPAPIPIQIRIPESIPCVIAAGGLNRNMKIPDFCSLGPVEWSQVMFYQDFPLPNGLIKPDVCGFPGPGYPIIGTGDKNYISPNKTVGGNSFSGPHISGTAALMFSANPEIPAWIIKELIEHYATPIGKKVKNIYVGAGLVDAFRAVEAAKRFGLRKD